MTQAATQANKDWERISTVDILKGMSIIFVLISHYVWSDTQRLIPVFPFVINMAIPIFMILGGYVAALSFRRHHITSFSAAYEKGPLLRKALRYTIPFLLAMIWQILDPNVGIQAPGILAKVKWAINGTVGQGSYYYPIMMQLILIFPVIYFLIKRKGRTGLWICFGANALYELLKWSYGMGDSCYRLLIFRYIFVIAAGVYALEYGFSLAESLFMTLAGGLFIAFTIYGLYKPRIITSWTSTSFLAVMWAIPLITWLIPHVKLRFLPLEMIGRASYNIFLVQMIYYRAYRSKVAALIKAWPWELLAGIAICVLIGLIFYLLESRLTGKIILMTER